jgi:hypothetical protein
MGSTIESITCQHCGNTETYYEFYYKTGEEYTNCNKCGYYYSSMWKRDDNGLLMTKDGTDDLSWENLINETHELADPYGAYTIKYIGETITRCGSIVDEHGLTEIINNVKQDSTVELFSVSRFVDGKIKIEVMVGE